MSKYLFVALMLMLLCCDGPDNINLEYGLSRSVDTKNCAEQLGAIHFACLYSKPYNYSRCVGVNDKGVKFNFQLWSPEANLSLKCESILH